MERAFLDRSRASWERYAATDPLWAVLSDPEKAERRWDEAAFFATGQREVGALIERLAARGWLPPPPLRVLDFGCGVGRLTRALAEHAAEVVGLDVSAEMVALAGRYCAGRPHCAFVQSAEPRLPFPDRQFGLIYSNLVLQHIAPPLARGYVAEFVRVLSPGGVCVFGLPEGRVPRRPRLRRPRDLARLVPLPWRLWLRRLVDPRTTTVTIACMRRKAVVRAWVEGAGGSVLAVEDAPPDGDLQTALYYVARA